MKRHFYVCKLYLSNFRFPKKKAEYMKRFNATICNFSC